MMASVFTPTHDSRFLHDCYDSLVAQTYGSWEWVVVPNGNLAKDPSQRRDMMEMVASWADPRVKIVPTTDGGGKIGFLKNFACSQCLGDVFIELDHDDILTPDALETIVETFRADDATTMVYSNSCQISWPSWQPIIWSGAYGWEFKPYEYNGRTLLEAVSPAPHPHNLSRIWYAPNHVRAWRASAYNGDVGPHDPTMKISDDHDLGCRHYLDGKVVHIDKCLYLYRVWGDDTSFEKNTWRTMTKEIERTMWDNYDRYIQPMMLKWANERGLRALDLGGAFGTPEGFERVDLTWVDVNADLNERWPFEDNSVGVLRAVDFIEHLRDPIHTMNEAWRVLAHGGVFMIDVPSTDGPGAFCDPTHVSFWNKRSFRYYTEGQLQAYIRGAGCWCRFQAIKVENITLHDNIPYVRAHLIAIKEDQPRFHGLLTI